MLSDGWARDGLGLGAQDPPLVFAFFFFHGWPWGHFCGCIQDWVVGVGCVRLGFGASVSGCFSWHAGTFLLLMYFADFWLPFNRYCLSLQHCSSVLLWPSIQWRCCCCLCYGCSEHVRMWPGSRTARMHRIGVGPIICLLFLSMYNYCNLKCNVIMWHLRLGIIGVAGHDFKGKMVSAIRRSMRMIFPHTKSVTCRVPDPLSCGFPFLSQIFVVQSETGIWPR